MIVLDASVLIAYLDAEDELHAAAEALLARAIDDELAINSLTLAEVLVAPVREHRLELVRDFIRDLEIQELPFPAHAAVPLAQLRADTALKMPDCCVLLAAEEAAASIASFDARLVEAATRRGLSVLEQ